MVAGQLLSGLDWSQVVPEQQWALWRPVIEAALSAGPRFAVGGGLAFSAYARRWRNTKDIDLFVLPRDREAMIARVLAAGYVDFHDKLPYDRRWIFRGYRDGAIIDVIWQMANYRTQVDEAWLALGGEIEIDGFALRLLPVEELIWSKLYVLQRDRCDWPDLLNLFHTQGAAIDWERLLSRVGDDAPLVGSALHVLGWMCPARARQLPSWIWPRLGVLEPKPGPGCEEDRRRIRLLDGRDWFGPKES